MRVMTDRTNGHLADRIRPGVYGTRISGQYFTIYNPRNYILMTKGLLCNPHPYFAEYIFYIKYQ